MDLQVREFTGEHDVPVDDKGRIFVPVSIRKNMPPEAPNALMVVRGFDQCLHAYPIPLWQRTAERLRALRHTDPDARTLKRTMSGQADQAAIDRQGRATIPRRLLARVGITDRMMIVGMLDYLELWAPAPYERWLAGSDGTLQETAQHYKI